MADRQNSAFVTFGDLSEEYGKRIVSELGE